LQIPKGKSEAVKTGRAIKNGQLRDTGNIEHRTNKSKKKKKLKRILKI
jgi:hypothetical protein